MNSVRGHFWIFPFVTACRTFIWRCSSQDTQPGVCKKYASCCCRPTGIHYVAQPSIFPPSSERVKKSSAAFMITRSEQELDGHLTITIPFAQRQIKLVQCFCCNMIQFGYKSINEIFDITCRCNFSTLASITLKLQNA